MPEPTRARPSMLDIARKAGVSRTAVSFVLNGRENGMISEQTRARVWQAAEALGYRPNLLARALATGRTNLIDLWSYGTFPAYHAMVISAFHRLARGSGYDLRLSEIGGLAGDLPPALAEAYWPADGIVLFDTPGAAAMLAESPAYTGVPVVSMGLAYHPGIDHVGIELEPAVREAVRYLASLGRGRVAYVTPAGYDVRGKVRRDAYEAAAVECGLVPETIAIRDAAHGHERSAARREIGGAVREGTVPGAMLCYNDETMVGVYRGLRDCGLQVPRDVALIGCDGIEETEYHDPRLSTLAVPFEEMCRHAWDLLRQRIEQPGGPVRGVLLTASLELRESSECSDGKGRE